MKWPALLALLLVVLALAAWAVRGPSRGRETRATVALDGAPAASEVEAPVARESERDARTSMAPQASAVAALPQPGFVGPPAPAGPPRRTSSVVIRVLHAGTREPASAGTVRLQYQVPREARASVASSRRSVAAELDPGGQAEFELPVGSSLGELALEPLPELLQGRRTSENARGRFLAQRIELDRETGQADLELDFEVQHGVDLAGRVFDAESGEALAGASVAFMSGEFSTPEALSARDGRFVLGEVELQAASDPQAFWGELSRPALWVHHDGYASARLPVDLGALAPLEVGLRRGLRIAGRVLDERGNAVGSARLKLSLHGLRAWEGAQPAFAVVDAVSDARGGFCFPPVAAADAAEVEISARVGIDVGSLALQRDLGPLDADLEGLELVVAPSVAICLRARLPNGELLSARDWLLVSMDGLHFFRTNTACDTFGREVWVPLGRRFELLAIADDDLTACWRGTRFVQIDTAGRAAQEIVIDLSESGVFEPPGLPAGAGEFVLPHSGCLCGVVDVQLLDAAGGRPLPEELSLQLQCEGTWSAIERLGTGALRVVGSPGRHSIEVEAANGAHDAFEVVIPLSGHAQAECRLRLSR